MANGNNFFANTLKLCKLMIRLDRIRVPLWLLGISFFTLIVPPAFEELYGNQAEREVIAQTMANPAMTAMLGHGDLENYTFGAMMTHQMLLMTAVVAGLMSILLVSRHTRADEEDGRLELIQSLPVGRLSYLNASLIVTLGTSILLALINGFGLYSLGIESMDLEGSLLYGAALGGTAMFFAGVTAVFAQLSESSRGTIGFSIAILLLSYLFRAITDVSNETLSWLSPLGWVTKTEAYSANNWIPIMLMIIASLLLFVLANYLNSIRDLERGFISSRPGRSHASSLLQSPIGLAFRLQRTGFISWAIGLYILGASYGSVLGDLESFFEGNELLDQLLRPEDGLTIVEQFMPMLIIVNALIATIPPIMAMNKIRGEEKKSRLDQLLGTSLSRTKLMGSYYILSIINGFAMLSLTAFGLWSAGVISMEGDLSFGEIYQSTLAYYPAVLVMIGITVCLIGWLPKFTSVIWMYLLYAFIVLYFGGLFQLSDWLGKLSPFGFIPQVPVEELTFLPLFLLTVIALLLTAIGFVGFNKRDIE